MRKIYTVERRLGSGGGIESIIYTWNFDNSEAADECLLFFRNNRHWNRYHYRIHTEKLHNKFIDYMNNEGESES